MTEHQLTSIEAADRSAEPVVDLWRNEVQERIAGYKKRRGRRVEGAFSMRFPFPAGTEELASAVEALPPFVEPPETLAEEVVQQEAVIECQPLIELPTADAIETPEETVAETQTNDVAEDVAPVLELVPEPEPEPFVDLTPRPRPKRKVIAFPRHLSVAPETVYRLADPVTSEVPRILDVPEELEAIPTTPFLDGLQFEVANAADSRDREHVELPFSAVSVAQRVFAGVIDVAIAGVGVGVFAGVAFQMLTKPPVTKPLVMGLVVAAGLVWSVYQYLFLVHAGKTLGMMAARIRLRTFKGRMPTLRQRRHRLLGFYLSALSLGMGLMWVFVDVDRLCWHDRLSRTYLTNRR